MFQKILLPSHVCDHSLSVATERLVSHPANARGANSHLDSSRNLVDIFLASSIFSNPPDSVIQAVMQKHDSNLRATSIA